MKSKIERIVCPCCENAIFIETDEKGKKKYFAVNPIIPDKPENETEIEEIEKPKNEDDENGSDGTNPGRSETAEKPKPKRYSGFFD